MGRLGVGSGLASAIGRHAAVVRWVSLGLIFASLLVIVRGLPIGPILGALEDRIEVLGAWGPLVFGLVYAAAVVLLVPASALTMAAGALFGPVVGAVTVSLASTTGAALAFLVARYLARGAVARRLARYPRFAAIDRAIGAEGWKVVALLRLSPAVPFNLQNYLYGLSSIGFWTCTLTSWVAMLPGTILYINLGAAGRAGLEAASGAGRSRTPAEWAALAVGLVATAALTAYLARLARRAIADQAGIAGPGGSEPEPSNPAGGQPWGTIIAAILAVASVAVSAFVRLRPGAVASLFGGLR